MDIEVFGMTINAWLQWIIATATASVSVMVFVYTTFSTKMETHEVVVRIDKMESRQDRADEKIDRKLEQINNKLDNIILSRPK